jgi:hypothetical protein
MTDDLSYQWYGSICVLLVDCRVITGQLDEDIVERIPTYLRGSSPSVQVDERHLPRLIDKCHESRAKFI